MIGTELEYIQEFDLKTKEPVYGTAFGGYDEEANLVEDTQPFPSKTHFPNNDDYEGVGDFREEEILQERQPSRVLLEKLYDAQYEQQYIAQWQQNYSDKYITRKRSWLVHWWRGVKTKCRFIFFPDKLPTRDGVFYRD